MESGILNLHAHLKNLEGKYIDLANFYKQELITAKNDREMGDDSSSNVHKRSMHSAKRSSHSNKDSRFISKEIFKKRTPRIEARGNSYSAQYQRDVLE